METTARYEEKYEQYKASRKEALGRSFRRIGIWAAFLIPGIPIGVWIYEEMVYWSSGETMEFIGCILLLFLIDFGALWPVAVVQSHKSTVARLNREMSLVLMADSLQKTFGIFTQGEVTYTVLQSHCQSDAKVEHNYRFAWLLTKEPLLIHRARITNGGTGEDEEVYFDGWALSVPAAQKWKNADRAKAEKGLRKAWRDTFFQRIAENPEFSLDMIEGKLWLTVGFHWLKLGEKDVPTDDLARWYQVCQEDVQLLKRAHTILCSVTYDSCNLK